jgi:hypothetical protein
MLSAQWPRHGTALMDDKHSSPLLTSADNTSVDIVDSSAESIGMLM